MLDAFLTNCVFKGKTRERNIRGGRSVDFPITGKMLASYHQPGTAINGSGNDPSDLNKRTIELDALMIADAAIYQVDELMNFYDVRQIYTKELGRALAYEYDKRVARLIWAAAKNSTEPLAKDPPNAGRVGQTITFTETKAEFDALTRQQRGDMLVDAIFDARVAFEERMCRSTICMRCSHRMTITRSRKAHVPSMLTSTATMAAMAPSPAVRQHGLQASPCIPAITLFSPATHWLLVTTTLTTRRT